LTSANTRPEPTNSLELRRGWRSAPSCDPHRCALAACVPPASTTNRIRRRTGRQGGGNRLQLQEARRIRAENALNLRLARTHQGIDGRDRVAITHIEGIITTQHNAIAADHFYEKVQCPP
jgi:hypothetical protein